MVKIMSCFQIYLMISLCFRFLATGESLCSLAFQYFIGVTTVSRIIPEVCNALWYKLKTKFMQIPETPDDWRLIAENFKRKWQFSNCIGAVDGKHVLIKSPANSGSQYFNYKGTFSVVLMALDKSPNMAKCPCKERTIWRNLIKTGIMKQVYMTFISFCLFLV